MSSSKRAMSQPRCFRINLDDNVATLLDDVAGPREVRVLGRTGEESVVATGPIKLGHKIAIAAIAFGSTSQAETLAAGLEKDFPTDTINIAVQIPAIRSVIALKRNQRRVGGCFRHLRAASDLIRRNKGAIYLMG